MSVQKTSIAFAWLALPPPAGTHCSRRCRPKLLPEEVQALDEKAGVYMEERSIPALFEPREGAAGRGRLVQHVPVCATLTCGGEVLQSPSRGAARVADGAVRDGSGAAVHCEPCYPFCGQRAADCLLSL